MRSTRKSLFSEKGPEEEEEIRKKGERGKQGGRTTDIRETQLSTLALTLKRSRGVETVRCGQPHFSRARH